MKRNRDMRKAQALPDLVMEPRRISLERPQLLGSPMTETAGIARVMTRHKAEAQVEALLL